MFTVALHCRITDQLGLKDSSRKLGLKDSSRKLVANYAINFVISLYLILHTYVKYQMGQRLNFKRRNKHPLVDSSRKQNKIPASTSTRVDGDPFFLNC